MVPAMILCAGFGSRLRPLTDFLPKPLLPVGDRPAFRHIADQLEQQGFRPLALNTHHRAITFEGQVPSNVTVLYEPSILGTAGGVANAATVLGKGDVLVWNGDMHLQADLAGLLSEHGAASGAVATLLASPRSLGEGTLGVDHAGRVTRLRGEKFGPEARGADYLGVLVLSNRVRETLPAEGCLVGDALLPALRAGAYVATMRHEGPWLDIGTPSQYLEANLRWLASREAASYQAPDAAVARAVRLRDCVVAGGSVEGAGELRECVVLPGGRLRAPAARCIGLPDGATWQVASCSPAGSYLCD